MGAPPVCRGSAAVAEHRGDAADGGLMLNVVDPLVVGDIGLSRRSQAEDRGRKAGNDGAGKSKLLHFEALLFRVRAVAVMSRFGCRSTGLGGSSPV